MITAFFVRTYLILDTFLIITMVAPSQNRGMTVQISKILKLKLWDIGIEFSRIVAATHVSSKITPLMAMCSVIGPLLVGICMSFIL